MINPNSQKQPRLRKVIGSENLAENRLTTQSPVPSQDKVRARAYELFENRGRKPGQDKQDWFRAEPEILNPGEVTGPHPQASGRLPEGSKSSNGLFSLQRSEEGS